MTDDPARRAAEKWVYEQRLYNTLTEHNISALIDIICTTLTNKLEDSIDINQHHVADAFWNSWKENGEPHKHGYYESTWMSIRAAIDAARKQDD